ncbi:hypothetical protein M2396_000675 [Pseudomonas sp. BIGb0278]|uniref:hypothetical protein n=1 Tax=Pseudomonas sp. BIGb0278 TaxID=2940607 RepID=UPI0021683E3D|nr:hypothetical protein [Pseudomonas sp. BIGb0278]MCS4282410.1 hypothetical protein [Pseudomonas sp. BIGb0278]
MDICFTINEVDWALTKDVFGIVSTLVSVVGVVAAIWFGRKGLSAWRQQLRGNSDHALAMGVLVELYKFRDSVAAAREPMFGPDFLNFGGLFLSADDRLQNYNGFSKELTARDDRVSAARSKLEAAAVPCEAPWNDSLREPLEKLLSLHNQLHRDFRRVLFVSNPEVSQEGINFYDNLYGASHVAFNDDKEPASSFTKDFALSLQQLELHLKGKIAK